MIVTSKSTGEKYIVASIIKVPEQESLYKLESTKGEKGVLVKESNIDKNFIKQK